MHMGMVVVGGGRFPASAGVGRRRVVAVAVVAEMIGVAGRMFERVANADHRGIGGVQAEQEGDENGKAVAHGGQV